METKNTDYFELKKWAAARMDALEINICDHITAGLSKETSIDIVLNASMVSEEKKKEIRDRFNTILY